MVNSNKIKGRMKELELTQADVATALGLKAPTVSLKINNARPFDLNEAEKLAELLKIDADKFGEYFFCRQSCTTQQV